MHWGIIVLLVILFLLFIIVITKINIELYYSHEQDNDQLTVKAKAWGLLSYKMNIPLIKIDKESASIVLEEEQQMGPTEKKKEEKITPDTIVTKLKETREFLNHVVGLHKIIRRFLKHISVTKLEWKTQLGVGDAVITGILAGVAWGIKGTCLGILSNYMSLKVMPKISVVPSFQSKQSYTRLSCMFSFRVGYAIGAAIQIARHWKRRKKKWQTILYKT